MPFLRIFRIKLFCWSNSRISAKFTRNERKEKQNKSRFIYKLIDIVMINTYMYSETSRNMIFSQNILYTNNLNLMRICCPANLALVNIHFFKPKVWQENCWRSATSPTRSPDVANILQSVWTLLLRWAQVQLWLSVQVNLWSLQQSEIPTSGQSFYRVPQDRAVKLWRRYR